MEWHGDDYVKDLEKELADNLEKACVYYKSKVKEALNRSQPYKRYGKTDVTVNQGGKVTSRYKRRSPGKISYKGLDPSAPGESPKKVTGFLQRSIAHVVDRRDLVGAVGTNLEYGFSLEIGSSTMEARPFLRTTLNENLDTITKIIATGKR